LGSLDVAPVRDGADALAALAGIKSVAYFGVDLAVALVSALLSDLPVIPALLVVKDRKRPRGQALV
jgi:hypothetical protein